MSSSRTSTVAWTASVPVAAVVSNVASYVLLLVAARLLTRSDYGQLSSLLGLLLIGTVPMLALQTVTARRSAIGENAAHLVPGAAVVTGCATAVFAAAAWPMSRFLHLSASAPLLVAATVPALAILGVAQGRAQGARRFSRLAVLIAVTTAGRSLGGLAGLLVSHSVLATMIGVLVGSTVAALAVSIRHLRAALPLSLVRCGEVATEAFHAAHAHSAFLLLTGIDVLLARHVLNADSAGLFAVGAVVTRATLWLPQSVVTVMFASLVAPADYRKAARQATAIVTGVCAAAVAGCVVAGPLVVLAVGGGKYRALNDYCWLFALLGAFLALIQLSLMAGLARRRVRRTAGIWLALAVEVVVIIGLVRRTSPRELVTVFVVITGVCAVAALTLLLRPAQSPQGPVRTPLLLGEV